MTIALGPIAHFMTRSLYSSLNSRKSWCSVIPVSVEAESELHFWLENLEQYNGQNIWQSPSAVRADASATGFGGFTVEHGPHIAHGQ